MKVIKSYTYSIVNPEPFEIPFPLVFELLSGNTLLAEYTISEEGVVDYSFNPNSSEKILTSITRALTLNDIYFLFTTRIFPDKTPYTAMEMERYEIDEYQPYHIIRKTRGILPGDKYWFRFDNENISYKHAMNENRAYYEASYKRYLDSLEAAHNEEKTETAAKKMEAAKNGSAGKDIPDKAAEILETSSREAMSDEMISSLMNKLGSKLEEDEPSDSDGGMMSDDAIAAMLAMNQPDEPEPASSGDSDGGIMSPEAIAAMLAANQPSEPEPAPSASSADSGDKMSDDDIAALLAANQG